MYCTIISWLLINVLYCTIMISSCLLFTLNGAFCPFVVPLVLPSPQPPIGNGRQMPWRPKHTMVPSTPSKIGPKSSCTWSLGGWNKKWRVTWPPKWLNGELSFWGWWVDGFWNWAYIIGFTTSFDIHIYIYNFLNVYVVFFCWLTTHTHDRNPLGTIPSTSHPTSTVPLHSSNSAVRRTWRSSSASWGPWTASAAFIRTWKSRPSALGHGGLPSLMEPISMGRGEMGSNMMEQCRQRGEFYGWYTHVLHVSTLTSSSTTL